MVYRLTDPSVAAPLFDGWQETLIWSCLQGVMGEIYADSPENPASAAAIINDFTFFAGVPNDDLIRFKPDGCAKTYMLMIPQNEEWSKQIEHCYGERCGRIARYAIKKEPDVFDREKLRRMAENIPDGCRLRPIDEEIYRYARETGWCSDWVGAYPDYETYRRLGFGFVLEKDGEIVAGVSSYTSYREGVEIEIDTHRDHRRKGYATVCAARMILEALDRGVYPSWDAANLWSVGLAEKLGYHFDHEYTTYEVYPY
ncbi:MAG: GNAT family N-acetyltransferase [Clostridia bacterium]|nr:GNAT family N-acetyltransferase [Clostridia bacterium]